MPSRSRPRFSVALVLLAICAAPVALAQTAAPKKPKKGAKPAASASASASAAPEPPPPAPEPAPSASAPSESSDSSKDSSKGAAAEEETAPASAPSEVAEKAGQKYYFVGLRYRGTIIPQFFQNLFVDDGGTVYSNSIGLELDMRQDGRSMVPWLMYTDYGMGDTLFLTKGKDPGDGSQYSVVNSGLKALYLGLDENWSAPLADGLDFTYGFGVGIGFVFGSLSNNWVYRTQSTNSQLTAANGLRFNQCQSVAPAADLVGPNSCDPALHQNSQTAKVGGYQEPNWFNGGSVPVVFPHIAIPDLGLRYKPIKQLAIALHAGFQITGFFWGLNVDYALDTDNKGASEKPKATDKDKGGGDQPEKPKKKKKPADSDQESGSYYVPGRDTL
jgi:hypothetical protein